jgi:hypothetical protein
MILPEQVPHKGWTSQSADELRHKESAKCCPRANAARAQQAKQSSISCHEQGIGRQRRLAEGAVVRQYSALVVSGKTARRGEVVKQAQGSEILLKAIPCTSECEISRAKMEMGHEHLLFLGE